MTRKIGSRYTVNRVIGRGTCGTVWEGTGPDGPVAVKLLREDLAADQTLIARFVQERTVLTSLSHPNVVAVRDLVVDGADLALVMDLVRGTDLRERLEAAKEAVGGGGGSGGVGEVAAAGRGSGGLRPAEAAALAADVAAGLAAAHARGVVHRDVKPENVLLDADSGTARLTDFGIARIIDGPRRTRATRIVGTPDYLAPEVIEGCPPGPAVDIYALGTLIFELLTGWTPFGGGHPGAVLRRHVTEAVPDIPALPEPLADLLGSCLSKAPAARLTAAEIAGRLRMILPDLAGLPALRVADPRATVDLAASSDGSNGSDRPVPMVVGSVPLVNAAADTADDTRQTHLNLMRPIREPLGPSAPVPVPGTAQPGRPQPDADSDGEPAAPADHGRHIAQKSHRRHVPVIAAIVAAALIAAGGYVWWHGHRDHSGRQSTGAPPSDTVTSTPLSDSVRSGAGASASSAADEGAAAAPVGPLGLVSFGAIEKPPVTPVGAVRFAAAGSTFLVAMTGVDGSVRYATAPAVSDTVTKSDTVAVSDTVRFVETPRFGAWRVVPGVSSAAEPAIVARASGGVELYVVSAADSQIHRALYDAGAGSWSGWSVLGGVGSTEVGGAPAAVGLDSGRTELLVASGAGGLLTATGPGAGAGTGGGAGSWQPWHSISAAGTVKPGVALAARSDGSSQAAFVVRASDMAVLRLTNSGTSVWNWNWSQGFSTGAVGQPEAAFSGAGKPDLFVQAASGDVQVYQPSGANLRGAEAAASAGVASRNPPGIAALPDQRLVVCVTAADGTVRLYASTV